MSNLTVVQLKKKVALVIILAFILSFSVAVLLPYIPLYGEDIGLSVSMIGYVVATYHLAQFLGRIPMGSLTDIYGYGIIIGFGGISLFLGMLFYILSPQLWPLLFMAQIMIGITVCMEWVTLPSFMTRFGLEKVPIFTFVVGWAYTFSVPLGGVLKDVLGMRFLFFLGLILSIPALVIVYLVIRNNESQDNESKEEFVSIISLYKDAFKTLKDEKVLVASLYSFLMFMNFNIAISLVPLYLSGLGFTATLVGIFQFSRLGTSSTIRLFSKRIERWISRRSILILVALVSGLALIVVSQLESLWLLILISAAWGLIGGLYHPAVFELIADGTTEEDRGKGMGIRGTLGTLGSFSGIVFFSNLAELLTVRTALLSSGISIMVGALMIEIYVRK